MIATAMRTLKLGVRSLLLHGLRSLLTCMGVLFGVASVIAMLAIGEGLSFDVQQRIQALGSNNVLVRSIKPPDSNAASAERSRISKYGITYQDAQRIQESVPGVEVVVLSDGAGADLSTLAPGDAEVRFARVGLRSDNAGITALDLRRSPVNDLDRQLFLTAHNFGSRPAEASVEAANDEPVEEKPKRRTMRRKRVEEPEAPASGDPA